MSHHSADVIIISPLISHLSETITQMHSKMYRKSCNFYKIWSEQYCNALTVSTLSVESLFEFVHIYICLSISSSNGDILKMIKIYKKNIIYKKN